MKKKIKNMIRYLTILVLGSLLLLGAYKGYQMFKDMNYVKQKHFEQAHKRLNMKIDSISNKLIAIKSNQDTIFIKLDSLRNRQKILLLNQDSIRSNQDSIKSIMRQIEANQEVIYYEIKN